MSKSAAKESRASSPAEGNREIMRFSPIKPSPAEAFAADLDTVGPIWPSSSGSGSVGSEHEPGARAYAPPRQFRSGTYLPHENSVLSQMTGARVQSSWMKVRPQHETQSPPRARTRSPLNTDPWNS